MTGQVTRREFSLRVHFWLSNKVAAQTQTPLLDRPIPAAAASAFPLFVLGHL
jgi:hypothetical protein